MTGHGGTAGATERLLAGGDCHVRVGGSDEGCYGERLRRMIDTPDLSRYHRRLDRALISYTFLSSSARQPRTRRPSFSSKTSITGSTRLVTQSHSRLLSSSRTCLWTLVDTSECTSEIINHYSYINTRRVITGYPFRIRTPYAKLGSSSLHHQQARPRPSAHKRCCNIAHRP